MSDAYLPSWQDDRPWGRLRGVWNVSHVHHDADFEAKDPPMVVVRELIVQGLC